jgi:hypothetical protein
VILNSSSALRFASDLLFQRAGIRDFISWELTVTYSAESRAAVDASERAVILCILHLQKHSNPPPLLFGRGFAFALSYLRTLLLLLPGHFSLRLRVGITRAMLARFAGRRELAVKAVILMVNIPSSTQAQSHNLRRSLLLLLLFTMNPYSQS